MSDHVCRPPLTAIAALAGALAVLPAVACAETSSWTSSTVTAPNKRPGETKLLKIDPARAAKGQQPAAGTGTPPPPLGNQLRPTITAPGAFDGSTHAKTPEPAGEDAAYEAFDQGRYLTALDLALKAAEKGQPQAHTLVGRIHHEGLAVAKDEVLAAQWYRRGAELGDAEAMFAFGLMLADGQGIKRDRSGAGQMFEAAAQRGHVLANYNLAMLFLRGDGKPENPHRAAAHLRYAADNGIAAAQYDLGTLYATGTGVEPNALEASRWIGRAAAAGYGDAELEYALMLFKGLGIEADRPKAMGLLQSAAGKGLPVAQNRLARVYANGLGTGKNLAEAAKWHLIAKSAGADDDDLEKLVAKLPRADRAKAEQAAAAWRESVTMR